MFTRVLVYTYVMDLNSLTYLCQECTILAHHTSRHRHRHTNLVLDTTQICQHTDAFMPRDKVETLKGKQNMREGIKDDQK